MEKMPDSEAEVKFSEKEINEQSRVLEEIRNSVRNLLLQIGRGIEDGEYDVMIGDDVSGRIPALMLWEASKKVSEFMHHIPPTLRFIAGSGRIESLDRENKEEAIGEYIKDWDKTKKKLVITEFVVTGESLSPLISTLQEKGFNVEIATMSSVWAADILFKMKKNLNCKIYSAAESEPKIYEHKQYSGVRKFDYKLFATPQTGYHLDQRKINSTHHQALEMGDDIADNYLRYRMKNITG